jgi:trehalose 6-phosphate synthase/phosphatase
MLGANLVCFQVRLICPLFPPFHSNPHQQTYSYCRHFLSTCIRVCGYETNSRGIDVDGHVTAVMHCPVGVDAERVGRDMSVTSISPFLSFSYLSI